MMTTVCSFAQIRHRATWPLIESGLNLGGQMEVDSTFTYSKIILHFFENLFGKNVEEYKNVKI